MQTTSHSLACLYTNLSGRTVALRDAERRPLFSEPSCVAMYMLHPAQTAIVLRMDALLLASLAGALAGIPLSLVREQTNSGFSDLLLDSMHEVLNVTASVLTRDGRAVLKRVITERSQSEAATHAAAEASLQRVRFQATVSGYVGGEIALYEIPA